MDLPGALVSDLEPRKTLVSMESMSSVIPQAEALNASDSYSNNEDESPQSHSMRVKFANAKATFSSLDFSQTMSGLGTPGLRHSYICTKTVLMTETSRFVNFVKSGYFQAAIGCCIVLNAISIGVQSNYAISNVAEELPVIFRFIERFFFFVFTTEFLLRLLAYGRSFFTVPEWRWNIFDLVIVVLMVVEEMTAVALDTGAAKSNFSFMRVMRVLRLVRIIRLVRLLRFVQELRTMVCSIASSLKSLCWTLVLLLLMMYVVGVYITQLIADQGFEDPTILDTSEDLYRYYGSLPRSVLSLYQAMTGGVDWDDLLVPLSVKISPWLSILFSIYIAFAVLALMNVVTGVFVESALLTAKEDREEDVMAQVRRLFDVADEDQSGTVTWAEFEQALNDPNKRKLFKVMDVDPSEARGLFVLMDTANAGEVSVEEFMQGCLRLRGPARAIDLATVMYYNRRMTKWWADKVRYVEKSVEHMQNMLEDQVRPDELPDHRKDETKPWETECGQIYATWTEIKMEGDAMASSGSNTRGSDLSDASSPKYRSPRFGNSASASS